MQHRLGKSELHCKTHLIAGVQVMCLCLQVSDSLHTQMVNDHVPLVQAVSLLQTTQQPPHSLTSCIITGSQVTNLSG